MDGDSFISHYVQIKPSYTFLTVGLTSFFISHYVQIKPEKCLNRHLDGERLYIPLCSDKTILEKKYQEGYENFISHYVQIKHRYQAVFDINHYSLYPTMFR